VVTDEPLTPLERNIDRLHDEGHSVYIWGWSADGRRALVVANGGDAHIASYHTANGVGRWECSGRHLAAHANLYRDRFPVLPWLNDLMR